MTYLENSAVLSDCGLYRYELTRRWEYYKPSIAWIMLNPSTADATKDDPTIRRCVRFSLRWGYGGVRIYNLFAYRATNPEHLRRCTDPIGPRNNVFIESIPDDMPIVCAWGSGGRFKDRGHNVLQYLTHANKFYLKRCSSGEPAHPLYLSYDLPLVRF